jgi:D-sedoheptulose 7-phosphate isomerase
MSRVPRPSDHIQRSGPAAGPGSVESLYPFLYPGGADPAQVFAQARESTVAKTREIIELRTEVSVRSSELLASCARHMVARFAVGGRLLTFGNGGSATDAQELASLFLFPDDDSPSLPALGLANEVSVLTSLANDVGVEVVFARQLAAIGSPNDIALGLSTSGNSENLLRAFDQAKSLGMLTIGVSGYDGGKMAELSSLDFLFVAPSSSIHRIQEAQTTIYHILWELVTGEIRTSPTLT